MNAGTNLCFSMKRSATCIPGCWPTGQAEALKRRRTCMHVHCQRQLPLHVLTCTSSVHLGVLSNSVGLWMCSRTTCRGREKKKVVLQLLMQSTLAQGQVAPPPDSAMCAKYCCTELHSGAC